MKDSPTKFIPIKNWAPDDKPREKLLQKGRETLSNTELITILLGTGTANRSALDIAKELLDFAQNDLNALAQFQIKDFCNIKGIGTAKAINIIAALELGRRRKEAEPEERVIFKSSGDIFKHLHKNLQDLPTEEFWIILCNNRLQEKHTCRISQGAINATLVDPRIIFKMALSHMATHIILAHNHPSGNLEPSQADLNLTKKLTEAGKFLDIKIVDHLIFTNSAYFSFGDNNLL
jgi:DNA repair protein RadC